MTSHPIRPVGFRVDANPASVSDARRRLTSIAAAWDVLGDAAMENLALCAAEVLANAAIHTSAPFVAAICWTGAAVRVEVSDASPVLPHLVAPDAQPAREAAPGLGLTVVHHIAAAWGAATHHVGKTVWFDVTPDGRTPGDHVCAAMPSSPPPSIASMSAVSADA